MQPTGNIIRLILTATLLMTSVSSFAKECTAKSGAKIVPLLELYTSEGCSSCPPADEWLSNLSLGADKVVPLAFHVDYWDYIGWKDKFAKSEYSERQRKNAALGGAGFVYTPQFTLNGKDFRAWNHLRLNLALTGLAKQTPRAHLGLESQLQNNGEVLIKLSSQTPAINDAKNASIYVAVYENKLSSQVNAGENNGRELKHDYVVRELFGPYTLANSNELAKTITLKSGWRNRNAGVVAFVQNSHTGEILQSLQLPFCN